MALGKLSSLGIGSSVLNYDMIDKLRQADENSQIKPIDKKLEKNMEKQTELVDLMSQVRELKTHTSKLADYSTYLGRGHNVIGDEIKATIGAGVPIQDIRLDISSVAKSDINEVGPKFAERESPFSQTDSTLRFFTKGKFYEINIKAGMSLEEVAQEITDKTNSEVIGTIMKTGGVNPYQLMINSKNTGEENRIYFGQTLEGRAVKSGELNFKDDDLTITLKNKNGAERTLNIELKTQSGATSQSNASALKQAVLNAIGDDSEFEGLIENGDLNVGLNSKGDGIVLNDKRGYAVQVGGNSASSAGFDKKANSAENYESKDLVATEPIAAGKLEGTLTIGSVPIDLAKITRAKNTSFDNAKAIAAAVDNIAGMHASATDDGRLIVNSDTGEVQIGVSSPEVSESIGNIKPGVKSDEIVAQSKLFKVRNVQQAQDAVFKYNDIEMTRASNTIDDVVTGISIDLLAETKPGKPAIINITRDDDEIVEAVQKFVEGYNALSMKVDEVTRFDEDTRIAGVFNGESSVREIRPALNKILSFTMGGGLDRLSLVKYGISVNEKGVMYLDSSKLRDEINADPESAKEFFQGKIATQEFREIEVDGVFKMLDKELSKFTDGSNSRLRLLEESLNREDKRLKEDRKKAIEMLDTRYDLMAQRFAAYDSQISKTNNAFNSVQMMIDQSVAKNK